MMPNKLDYHILTLDTKYISQLVEIEQECFSDPWTYHGFEVELSNKNAYFILAVSDKGEVYGYIGMHIIIDEGYIANIAVREKYRRFGIASTLMDKAIRHANDVKLALITLEVRESNTPAISFYERYGFEKLGVRKNYYTKPIENGLIMTKFIRESL